MIFDAERWDPGHASYCQHLTGLVMQEVCERNSESGHSRQEGQEARRGHAAPGQQEQASRSEK